MQECTKLYMRLASNHVVQTQPVQKALLIKSGWLQILHDAGKIVGVGIVPSLAKILSTPAFSIDF